MAEEIVLQVPSADEVNAAATIAQVAEVAASASADSATVSAATAEAAATEVIEQMSEDEEWLEKQLMEIRTQISEMKLLMAPIMEALTAQSNLVSNLVSQVTLLSTPVISSPPSLPNPESQLSAVVDPEAAVIAPIVEEPARKKRHKI